MRFKRLLPILLSVTTSVFTLSGCSDFDNDWTANEIMYKESFAKTFGKIDPEQDWNLASRAGVTVTCDFPTNVKIYAKKGDKFKIVGDYANVNGTQTLYFDLQKGISDILVTNGETSFFTKVGESLKFLSTRTAHSTGTTITIASEYKDFDYSYVKAVTDLLPEEANNIEKVTENFSYVSTGPFTIYPIYWNTSSVHTMGVYYKDADGKYQTIPFYDTRVGDELALKKFGSGTLCEHDLTPWVGAVGSDYPNPTITKVDGNRMWYDAELECFDSYYKVGDKCSEGVHTFSKIAETYTGSGVFEYYYNLEPSEYTDEFCSWNGSSVSVGETCEHGYKITLVNGTLVEHKATMAKCTHDNSHSWVVGDICEKGHEITGLHKESWESTTHRMYNGYAEYTGNLNVSIGATCEEGHVIDYISGTNKYCNSTFEYDYISTFYRNAYVTDAFNSGSVVGSKGITINLPVGTQFGFYLDVYDGEEYADDKMSFENQGTFYHTVYSQAEVNQEFAGKTTMTGKTPNSGTSWTGKNSCGTYVFASTFNRTVDGKDVKYICFEDWNLEKADLQDLVFVIDGSTPPVTVDEDAEKWVICAEDLGNTFDLDYNDVVLGAQHVSGKTTAIIAPLAAGGTLASYVYFGSTCLGEIHELLGAEKTKSGKYTPMNVNGAVSTPKEIEVNVDANWSLASSTIGDDAYTGNTTMGGISIRVVPEGMESIAGNADGSQAIQNSFAKGEDNVPYLICIPMEFEKDGVKSWFRWPNEMTPISPIDGYDKSAFHESGHTFSEWVQDHNKNDWYKYADKTNTTGLR